VKKPRKIRPRRLQMENLERREVMTAGLTAVLNSAGVLTVTGTGGDDEINFRQSGGLISIEDVAQSFKATKVKSIVVDLGAGNDLVSLNSFGNGGSQSLAEKVTVRSGAGNESVELMNGQLVNFAGAGHSLVVQPTGTATLDNQWVNLSNAVQMSLANGVLTVTGTNSSDQIRFIQNDGWLGIVGGSQWFSASTVNSIVVNLQDGNDSVSFDSLYCGCNQSITAALTVNFGMGSETIRLPDGTETTYSGFGNQLTYVNGVAKLNGVAINANTVQMSYANGVLTVTGTSNGDTIKFIQNNGWMGIQGGSDWFQASTVSSIVVNANGGDDLVSFDSIQNGCNQAITAALTVNGTSGNDAVRMPNGFETTLAAGNTLTYANGVTKLNNVTINAPDVVVMSFANGVLTITAKSGGDDLRLIQSNGWMGIVGGSQWYQASTVTSIVVHLQGGTDYLSLDSIFNGCNQAITAQITVNSSAGSKQVRCPNGNTASFSGAHQLIAASSGAVTLDGVELWPAPQPDPDPQPQNWFDANVQDAALRTLGSSLYTDGLIDRSDIIALLRDARDGGTIDSTELADLRAMAANATIFGSGAHVRALTGYVVNNTVANGKYQGATLGNLAAGSLSTHMDNLINKWFLGLDRPTAGGAYRQMAGTLFVNGAAYGDVKQGSIGDCYFMASLGEAAYRNASIISNMFIANGDGTYTVKFFNQGTQYFVTVDSYLPTNTGGSLIYAGLGASYTNSANELWVPLAEKAYVQLNEFGFTRAGLSGSGQNAYSAINGGYIYAAMHNITGLATSAFAMTSGSTSFTTFVNAYNGGKMIGFASYASPPAGSGVVGSHAYAVVGYDAANQTVTLFNPWGTQYGLLTLNWSQIQANFQYFDRTA
jgi:hypothetical protein